MIYCIGTMKKVNKSTLNPKIGPVGEAIIASIALVGIVSIFALFPGMTSVIAPFLKRKKQPRKQIVQKSVESLIRAGLVEKIFHKNGDIQVKLTTRGKWEAFLRHSGPVDKKTVKWDKVWRVVVFDVPISKNKLRSELRRAMVLYGFKMLQQSVWVYPHACDDFIEVLKEHLGVANDVLYMKVGYIENDKYLQKEFNIV